jgi:hypothetical protein
MPAGELIRRVTRSGVAATAASRYTTNREMVVLAMLVRSGAVTADQADRDAVVKRLERVPRSSRTYSVIAARPSRPERSLSRDGR